MSIESHLQTFDLHDISYSRSLPLKEVANVLRACGRLATVKEMDELLKPYSDPMSRSQFAELVASLKPGPKESDLLTAIQAFDHKELGTLSRVEVSTIFTQMNEKLTSAELDGIMADLPFGSDDRVPIEAIVKRLMMPVRQIKVPPSEVARRIHNS